MNNKINNQKGNILFLILIAVALFAALSYAVTRSGRNSDTISDKKAEILANEVLQFLTEVGNAVNKVMLINGCKDTQLNFYNEVYTDTSGTILTPANHNPNSPPDKRCHIFDPAGGGVVAREFQGLGIPNQVWGGKKAGHGMAIVNKVSKIGEPTEYDILYSFSFVRKEVCRALHKKAGLEYTNFSTDFTNHVRYDGVFAGVTNNLTESYMYFCKNNTQNENAAYLYYVLLPR